MGKVVTLSGTSSAPSTGSGITPYFWVGFIVMGGVLLLTWNTKLRPIVMWVVILIFLGWTLRFWPAMVHGAQSAEKVL